MKKKLAIGILFLLAAIILAGCAKKAVIEPLEPAANTCAEVKGFECKLNEACSGKILPASGTENGCCSVKCEPETTTSNAEVPKFDFGKVNDNLGSLQ